MLADYASGETIDLSLGGASIFVREEILPGEMLKVDLRPKTERDAISVVAHVLRSGRSSEAGRDGYVLGCKFVLADASLQRLLQD